MISKNIQQLPKSLVEVTITVPWEDLSPRWDSTLQKLNQELELPGFRKGTAPLPMVEQHLGNKVSDEVFKTAFPQFLVEALQGSNIVPIDYPRYQITSFSKGQPLTFKATITQKPEVKIGEYKGIQVQRPPLKAVIDEEVEKITADLFKRWQTRQPAAPAPQTSQPSPAGSMTFNSQPNPQTSSQPASPYSGLASLEASRSGPDDNFAKAMGTLNLPDLRTKIKADLENEAKYNNELDYEEAILQEIEKRTQVEIPDVLVEDELHRMLVSLQKRVADTGLLMDEYLKSQGETLESLNSKWRSQAEKNVRMELGLSEIARLENVSISDSELQAEIDKIQDARLKAQFEAQEPRMHLRHSLRQVKTLDLLKSLVKTP